MESVILEEDIDEDYEPTEAEIEEYERARARMHAKRTNHCPQSTENGLAT